MSHTSEDVTWTATRSII